MARVAFYPPVTPSYAHYARSKVSYHSSQFSRGAFWLAESARRYYDLIGRCEIGYFAWLADENESSFWKKMATYGEE